MFSQLSLKLSTVFKPHPNASAKFLAFLAGVITSTSLFSAPQAQAQALGPATVTQLSAGQNYATAQA